MQIKEIVKVVGDGRFVSYQRQKIEEYVAFNGERALTHSFVCSLLGNLMGKVLTIVDATIPEAKQNKSVKDLMRNSFSDIMGISAEKAFDQEILQDYLPDMADKASQPLEEVEIEDVLGVPKA